MKKSYLYISLVLLLITAIIAQAAYKIDDLIGIGLEENHSLRLGRESFLNAKLNKADFFADYLPNLSLSSNYTRYISDEIPMMADREYQSNSVSANMTWTLFSGGSRYLSYKSTASNLRQSKISLADSERETAYRIRSACFNVIYTELAYETAEKNLESAHNQYELIRERNNLGLASKVDMMQMEVELANAKLSVLRSKNSLKATYRALNQMLNFPLDSTYEITDKPMQVIQEPPELSFYMDRAENSTRMMQIQESYRNSLHNANHAYSSFLPSITASASYSWSDDRMAADFARYTDDGTSSISLNASWYLIQGGKRIISLAQAQSSKRSAEINRDLSLQSYYNDIKGTYESLIEARSAYEVAKAQYESAEIGLELVEEQYRLGNSTVLDLLNARVSYQQSHNSLISALQTYRTQMAKMDWLCPSRSSDF
ncbi:MAG: TolC family protein [Candidatus Zixiibacteriota bacterium]